jgi:surface carbohydrate biosynthesis protein (TIGR04326 family)
MIEKIYIKNNNFSQEIILKDYLERNAFTLKKKYLNLISKLSNFKIKKKKLEEYYIYKKNHSLWEMSLLKEKNPFKSPKIFTVIKFLACRKILFKNRNDQIEFCLYDPELQEAIKELKMKNVTFVNQIKKKQNFQNFLNFAKIFKFLLQNKLIFKNQKLNYYKNKEVLILSYFAHYKEKNNNFYFSTWNGIEKILKKISWIQIFIKSEKYKNRKSLLEKKFENNEKLVFLYDFLNIKIIIIVIFNFFKYFIKYRFIYSRIKKTKDIDLRSLIKIQKIDFYESLFGFHLFLNLTWIHIFEYFLSKIEKKKIGLFTFENQNWEKAFITEWKNNNHGKLIAYVPTTINFWHLNYYNSASNLDKKNKKFSPDIIFSNSHYNSKELQKLNLYSVKIKEVEALRYNYLRNYKITIKNTPSENKVLFLGDYSDDINKSFLDFFKVYQEKNNKIKLYIKPHPASVYFFREDTLKNYEYKLADFDVNNLAKKFIKIISSNSTSAGIEFLFLGKDIMIYDPKNFLDLSPFKNSKLFYLNNINQIDNFIPEKKRIKKFKNFFILNNNYSNWKKNIRCV